MRGLSSDSEVEGTARASMAEEGDAVKKGFINDFLTFLALALWLGLFHLNILVAGLCFWNFPSPWALTESIVILDMAKQNHLLRISISCWSRSYPIFLEQQEIIAGHLDMTKRNQCLKMSFLRRLRSHPIFSSSSGKKMIYRLLVIWTGLIFIPARYDDALGQPVARFICKYAVAYFPIEVVFEDKLAFDVTKSYVFAAEPHSLLPIGIIVLTPQSGVLPISNLRSLATSAIFWTPVVKHVWTWLGLVPVTRKRFTELLQKGTSAVIIPGGVQECLHMERGREVVYLKKRFGFVKVAMEAGSPIVPTFCFGQTKSYRWWKPTGQWYSQLSRAIGFTPLVFWGRYGLPIPFRSPMTFVIGKPIEVAKNPKASREEVAAVLEQYIEAVKVLFEKHKSAAGFNDIALHVY